VPVTLYAATTNPGKLRDFSVAASEGGFTVAPLPGLNEISTPVENEPTFIGNARLKAQYYSGFAPGFVLADDSGLEVDALGGEPGVRSARFADDAISTSCPACAASPSAPPVTAAPWPSPEIARCC
jgi:XTP/dITP diphosphohydrolase